MEQEPLKPGTWQHFLEECKTIIETQTNGEVRCVFIVQSAADQFLVNGQMADVTWMMGMLQRAAKTVDFDYQAAFMELREKSKKVMDDFQFNAVNKGGGKPQ